MLSLETLYLSRKGLDEPAIAPALAAMAHPLTDV